MNQEELAAVIDGVAEVFEETTHARVTPEAREALLRPAIPHVKSITEELDSGEVDLAFLSGAIAKVLVNASAEYPDATSITEEAVAEAMKKDCPYLGWC